MYRILNLQALRRSQIIGIEMVVGQKTTRIFIRINLIIAQQEISVRLISVRIFLMKAMLMDQVVMFQVLIPLNNLTTCAIKGEIGLPG